MGVTPRKEKGVTLFPFYDGDLIFPNQGGPVTLCIYSDFIKNGVSQ